MKTAILIILIMITGSLNSEPVYIRYSKAFGFKASNISGYGAFYGYRFTEKWRIQATGIGYMLDYTLDSDLHSVVNYTIGTEIQKDIIQELNYRCYLMAGCYYYHDDDNLGGIDPLHIIKTSYNAGFGMGYEYFFHRVSFGLEAGYKLYRDYWKEQRGESTPWIPVREKVSKIGAGLNLGFVF